jgi:tetratricopeptide (TPR) repeat protein
MILGKKKTVPDIKQKDAELSKGNGSGDVRENKPEDATMWGNKGNSLVESSMYDDAIKCYDKALEINPGSMEAWNNKGLALARTGRLAEAVQCYDRALEIDPGDSEVIYNKGISLARLGKSNEAIECYDKLLAVNPQDADAWCSKGDVLFESGRYEDALAAYNKSIEIYPKDEVTWNNRGMTLVKLNRFTEAIESYDKALEINPKVEKIWSNKGLAIAKMEESKDKVNLQKLAAALPREDKIPPVNMQPAGQPDMEPAKKENVPLNNQMVAEEVNTVPIIEAPLSGQVDIIPDMQGNPGMQSNPGIHGSIHEMPVEEVSSDAIYKATGAQVDTSMQPVDASASAIGTPPQDQIQPSNQVSESPVTQVEATNIEKAAVEEPALSAPKVPDEVKTAQIAENAVSGQVEVEITPAKGEIEQKPLESPDINEKPGDSGIAIADQPINEVKIAPAGNTVPEQVDLQSDSLCSKPGSTAGKEVSIIADKASNTEKCLVSVPVDAYIVNPFISKPPSDQAAIKADEEGTNSQPEDKTAPAFDSDILKLVEIDCKHMSKPVPDKALEPEKVKKSEEYLVMGNALYSQGKYEDAIECFNRSLQMHLGNNTAWNNKGLALSKTGKFDEAIMCYDKALVINPKDYVVLNNKGSALYKKGEIEKALKCYRDALELNPDSKTAKRGVNICMESVTKSGKGNRQE